jgi:RNA polymerase sigma-70 factor (ECF subfamily)
MDEPVLNAAMDRYANGDARAFTVLHRALQPRLLAFLMRMTGTAASALADDLTQETFLRMHRARATFAKGGAVIPWAYAIARNVYIDHVRAARQRTTERLPSDPGAEPADPRANDAEATAIASQTAAAVERVLASIPAAQREAFVLLRYEGLSVQDAAAVLGATQTAVKLRAFRAYEALRGELEELRRHMSGEKDAVAHDGAKPARVGARTTSQATSRATRERGASGRAGGDDGA